MDRREFIKGSALAVAGAALKQVKASTTSRREFVVENAQLAWRLESSAHGIRSVSFENRLSGREFSLLVEDEFKLIFSNGQRIEIPWWDFCLTDDGSIAADRESGLAQGFHTRQNGQSSWKPVKNLAGGQKGPRLVVVLPSLLRL